jgi:hypothetical protein
MSRSQVAWSRGLVEFGPRETPIQINDGSAVSSVILNDLRLDYGRFWQGMIDATASGDTSALAEVLSPDLASSWGGQAQAAHAQGLTLALHELGINPATLVFLTATPTSNPISITATANNLGLALVKANGQFVSTAEYLGVNLTFARPNTDSNDWQIVSLVLTPYPYNPDAPKPYNPATPKP